MGSCKRHAAICCVGSCRHVCGPDLRPFFGHEGAKECVRSCPVHMAAFVIHRNLLGVSEPELVGVGTVHRIIIQPLGERFVFAS